MLIEERKDCILTYDEHLDCVIQEWRGTSTSQEFRATIEATIEFFKTKNNISGLISDTTDHNVVKPSDIEWTTSYANPILSHYGMRKMAFVVPENILAQLSVIQFSRNSTKLFKLRHFSSKEEALGWIGE